MKQSRWRAVIGNASVPAALAVVSVLVALGGDRVGLWLRYERDGVLGGEVWRLLSAHLVHLGWSHVWLNLAGLALVWLLFAPVMNPRAWLLAALVSAAGVGVGLLVLQPQIEWYVGLSGVLHGLLVAGAIADLRAGHRVSGLLLVAVMAKLAWEQWQGPVPGSAELAGGTVIVAAHLYGAVAGALYAQISAAAERRTAM